MSSGLLIAMFYCFCQVSSLKRSLKNPNLMLGDGVSRAFMRTLVQLIGGYRDSLKFTLGEKISFDAEAFIQTRPASVQPFLETMLHLQIFQQVYKFLCISFLCFQNLTFHWGAIILYQKSSGTVYRIDTSTNWWLIDTLIDGCF